MTEINMESVLRAAEELNLGFADNDTDQDKLEKVLLAYQEDRSKDAKQTGVILAALAKYEQRASGSWQYELTTAAKVEGLLHHLMLEAKSKQDDMDKLTEHVIENLTGMRVLANMILNVCWNHSMKNNVVQAMAELVETAITRLRESRWDFGDRFDPFAPNYSRMALWQDKKQAEAALDQSRERVRELKSLLTKHGINENGDGMPEVEPPF